VRAGDIPRTLAQAGMTYLDGISNYRVVIIPDCSSDRTLAQAMHDSQSSDGRRRTSWQWRLA